MLLIFLTFSNLEIINIANDIKIIIGSKIISQFNSIFIIDKLNNPCNRVAVKIPKIVYLKLFFVLIIESTIKYPTKAEQSVCRKVAPRNLEILITTEAKTASLIGKLIAEETI